MVDVAEYLTKEQIKGMIFIEWSLGEASIWCYWDKIILPTLEMYLWILVTSNISLILGCWSEFNLGCVGDMGILLEQVLLELSIRLK